MTGRVVVVTDEVLDVSFVTVVVAVAPAIGAVTDAGGRDPMVAVVAADFFGTNSVPSVGAAFAERGAGVAAGAIPTGAVVGDRFFVVTTSAVVEVGGSSPRTRALPSSRSSKG